MAEMIGFEPMIADICYNALAGRLLKPTRTSLHMVRKTRLELVHCTWLTWNMAYKAIALTN